MRTLYIQRCEDGTAQTFGVAYSDNGRLHLSTIERGWVDADHDGHRDRNVSRIPAGTYEAYRRKAATTKRGYDVYELLNVPDTANAQIHIANTANQLEGCIAVGVSRGYLSGVPAVLDSRTAYDALMAEFKDERIRVIVRDVEAAV